MAQVLVVDDDPVIRKLLTYAFSMEDFTVETLCDGRGVVERLRAATSRIVVLMDVMMPNLDGLEVCRLLCEEPETLSRHAVVLMSAGLTPGETVPAGARAALAKPFDLDRALALVESLSAEPADIPAPDARVDDADSALHAHVRCA